MTVGEAEGTEQSKVLFEQDSFVGISDMVWINLRWMDLVFVLVALEI